MAFTNPDSIDFKINFNSIDFKLGVLYEQIRFLSMDDNYFTTIIQSLNGRDNDVVLNLEMLEQFCHLYCSEVNIVTYKGERVVVVGEIGLIFGVVYLNEKNKVVELEYDEDELEEFLAGDTDSEAS